VLRRGSGNLAPRYAEFAEALLSIGRLAEAEAFLAIAMDRFPQDSRLAICHARVADAGQDRAEALRRWQDLSAGLPKDPEVAQGLNRAIYQLELARADAYGAEAAAQAPSSDASEEAEFASRELLLKFESLGESCELGFVQRHFKAEPLGLLRWAGVPFETLLDGLQSGFAGLGDAKQTILYLDPISDEYRTFDRRYCINMHAFIRKDLANQEKTYELLRARLQFLKDKLLADLQSSEKIFVHVSGRELDPREIDALRAALSRYGKNTLLCVRPRHGNRAPGQVDMIGDGLLAGWVDRLGYDGKRWDISFDCWLALCQKAAGLSDKT
jgi:hypothetical protein